MKQLIVLLGLGILICSCGKEKDPKYNTFTYSTWDLALREDFDLVKGVVVGIDTFVINPLSTTKNIEIVGFQYVTKYTDGTSKAQNFYIKDDTIKFLDGFNFFAEGDRAVVEKESENLLIFNYDRWMGFEHPYSYYTSRYTFKKREEAYKSQAGCATCWQTQSNNKLYVQGFANKGFDITSESKLGVVCGPQLTTYKNVPIIDKLQGSVTYRTTTFCKE